MSTEDILKAVVLSRGMLVKAITHRYERQKPATSNLETGIIYGSKCHQFVFVPITCIPSVEINLNDVVEFRELSNSSV